VEIHREIGYDDKIGKEIIMKERIWNFWADKYDKLWVQKYSLKPTRDYVLKAISDMNIDKNIRVLDLGCGSGQLIHEMSHMFNNLNITGIDFSEKMIEMSQARNQMAQHIKLNADELYKINDKYDLIICTHSLPYYKEPEKVLMELSKLLNDDGNLLIGFASGNNFYDKLILSFVKLTTGPANYPSDEGFRKIISSFFKVESLGIIKEKIYMPRIAVYKLKKAVIC